MKCTLKNDGIKTYFDVDGKAVYPAMFGSYNIMTDNVTDAKNNGMKAIMFPVYAGDEGINMESGLRPFYKNFFKGYGKYDFSPVEELLEIICSDVNEELYLVPRVCLEPPKWWQKANPDEVARDYRGEPQRECFTSEKWRKDMTEALFALIDYFNNSKWKDKIIGIHVAAGGTEEWAYQARYHNQFYDYSEPNRKAYIKWLENKYKTVKNLSKAWGETISDFADVQFPKPIERRYAKKGFLRNKKDDMPVLDFYDFHNIAEAETIEYFCKQVKEYTNNEKITGVFYGYTYTVTYSRKGTHALEYVLKSPYVDYVSTTNIGSGAGDPWYFSCAVKSAQLHNKMYIAEADMKTHLRKPLSMTMPHAAPDNDWYSRGAWLINEVDDRTLQNSIVMMKKALLRVATAKCGMWWYDHFGGYFKEDNLLYVISKSTEILENQKHDYLKADVAYLLDETGYKYYTYDERPFQDAVVQLGIDISAAGFPYDCYLLSDIEEDNFPADDYKLFIIRAGIDVSDETKAAIEKKLKNKNKTVLWLHNSSCYDSSLCGFELNHELGHIEKAVYKKEVYNGNGLETLQFKDDNGYVLSRFEESGDPAVIWRDMGDWASVYYLPLEMNTHLLREIALLSGVHLYNLTDDYVFAGGEYVGLCVRGRNEGGYKRLNLPERGFKATNALTGEELPVNDMFIDFKLDNPGIILIHLSKDDE